MKKNLLFLLLLSTFSKAQIALVKGPYIQLATPSSVIIRWETTMPSDSRVLFGLSPSSLSLSVTNSASANSHSLQLNSLSPYTKYYYAIGTATSIIQGDSTNYFITSPLPGTPGKYRFWVTGDCGNLSQNQMDCKNAFLAFSNNTLINGWLLLGDNAYYSGTDAEYNSGFFSVYQNDIMKRTVLWPAPGNHDYSNGSVTNTTVPYYSIFTTPVNGEAGGIPSLSPAYYSYDYGNIHFISLDSYGTDIANKKMYDTLSQQALWLKQDLAVNKKTWTIVYWHHPPFSMGSHNSDTEQDLVQIREEFIRILERYNVDLILCGHSHDYERSKLMKGHYGPEATFTASVHHLDSSSALYNGAPNSCPYVKDTVEKQSGTVYVVSGSAGQVGGAQASFPHDAMFYSNASDGGSLILDFDNNRLDAKWLCGDGLIRDQFTIMKHVNAVKTFTAQPDQTINLSASWPGTYTWSTGETTRSVSVNAMFTETLVVRDAYSCLADTIKLHILPKSDFKGTVILCAGNSAVYKDETSNSPVSWNWSVLPANGVDINTPSSQNPAIRFSNPGIYSIVLKTTNQFGNGMQSSKTVTVEICEGSPDPMKMIRPNPNNGNFIVEVSQVGETDLVIYNLLGDKIFKGKLNYGSNNVCLNEGAGVYYYAIIHKGHTAASGKILVVR